MCGKRARQGSLPDTTNFHPYIDIEKGGPITLDLVEFASKNFGKREKTQKDMDTSLMIIPPYRKGGLVATPPSFF